MLCIELIIMYSNDQCSAKFQQNKDFNTSFEVKKIFTQNI